MSAKFVPENSTENRCDIELSHLEYVDYFRILCDDSGNS